MKNKMKKCQDCRANHNNEFCQLEYKTEHLKSYIKGITFEYISPLEKCDKPKNKNDYLERIKKLRKGS